VVAVAAGHELALDLAGRPVGAGVADQPAVVHRHVRGLEAQVAAVGQQRGDHLPHDHLLRHRLPGMLAGGEQVTHPVHPDLQAAVGREPLDEPAQPPVAEHARRAVLDHASPLPLFHAAARLPLKHDAADPAAPQQQRRRQARDAAAHDRDRSGFTHVLNLTRRRY
jgi:hypothetical protein